MAGMPGTHAPTRAPVDVSLPQEPLWPSSPYGPIRTIWRGEPTTAEFAGVALALAAGVLAFVAWYGPWFSMSMSGTFSGVGLTVDEDWGLFAVSAHARGTGIGVMLGYGSLPGMLRIFLIPQMLLLVGLVLTGFSMRINFRRGGSGVRAARAATGILAGVLVAAAPLYLMVTLPAGSGSGAALSQGYVMTGDFNGFWGSGTVTYLGTTLEMAWGAAWAWYVALLAAFLVALGGILTARERPQPEGPEFVPYRPTVAPSAPGGEPAAPATPPAPPP